MKYPFKGYNIVKITENKNGKLQWLLVDEGTGASKNVPLSESERVLYSYAFGDGCKHTQRVFDEAWNNFTMMFSR